jgi:predicted secreted Zn-dependent protease
MNRVLKCLSAALAMLAIAGCTSTASRITTSYYVISGATGEELDREISAKGPLKGHALASAAIRFVPVAIDYNEAESSCGFRTVKFRIEAAITLPKWREQGFSRDRELRDAWQFLARYARQHEDVHVKIAEKYAAKIADELMLLPARKSCESLDNAAEKILRRNKREHDREQTAFDRNEQKKLAALFSD